MTLKILSSNQTIAFEEVISKKMSSFRELSHKKSVAPTIQTKLLWEYKLKTKCHKLAPTIHSLEHCAH